MESSALHKTNSAPIDYNQAYRELKQEQPLSDPRAVLSIATPFPDWRDFFAENLDEQITRDYIAAEMVVIEDIFGPGGLVRTEHIGSTSIPGMCGMLLPDLILFVKQFPPSNDVFQRLVSAGFSWRGLSQHLKGKDDDLFFTKRNFSTPKDGKTMMGLVLHVVPEDFKLLDPLVRFRDLARSNSHIRDDYRKAKLEVYHDQPKDDPATFGKYKNEKSKKFGQEILTAANIDAKAPDHSTNRRQLLMPHE